jgi:tetratricopeptide (TPR) repeat protein
MAIAVAAMGIAFAPDAGATPSRAQAEIHKKRGDEYARNRRLGRAEIEYKAALALDPSFALAHNELGNVYFAKGQFDLAVQHFRQALQHRKHYSTAQYNLAYALRKAGKLEEARGAYRAFLQASPRDPDAYYGLAETQKALGDGAGAIASYRRYIALEKRPSEAAWVLRAKAEIAALEKAPAAPKAPATVPEAAAAAPVSAPRTAALPIRAPKPTTGAAPLPPARPFTGIAAIAPARAALPPAPAPVQAAPVAPAPATPAPAAAKGPPRSAPAAAKGPPPAGASAAAAPIPGPPGTASAPAPGSPARDAAPAPSARVIVPAPTEGGALALARKGELAFLLRDFEKARSHLESAAKERSTAEIHFKLGAARAAAGDLRAALASFETAAGLDPKNEAARDLVLRVRAKLGLVDADTPAGDPADRARRLLAAGRPAVALRALQRAGGKPDPAHLSLRAEALLALGRYRAARRALLLWASLRPADPLPYYHLATCHRRIAEPERAAYYFKLYLSLADPADAGAAPRVREARRFLASGPRR